MCFEITFFYPAPNCFWRDVQFPCKGLDRIKYVFFRRRLFHEFNKAYSWMVVIYMFKKISLNGLNNLRQVERDRAGPDWFDFLCPD
jgi:hypothetical protein